MGLAIRIARRIGVHKDGAHYIMSAWTTEMRRRTWRLLRILDVKALESQGAEADTYSLKSDTQLPQNTFDLSWDPCEYDPKAPTPEVVFTEMTFPLVQAELSSPLQSLLEDEHPLFDDVQSYVDYHGPRLQHQRDRIYSIYLKDIDMNDPMQRMT